jgi:hypothetical protein
MDIRMDEEELHEAIGDWVRKEGVRTADKTLEIAMTAGRGVNGFYADIKVIRGGNGQTVATDPFLSDEEIAQKEEDRIPATEQVDEGSIDEDQQALDFS